MDEISWDDLFPGSFSKVLVSSLYKLGSYCFGPRFVVKWWLFSFLISNLLFTAVLFIVLSLIEPESKLLFGDFGLPEIKAVVISFGEVVSALFYVS